MDFGRVPLNQLNDIDFSLPKEPAFNRAVLKGKPANNPKVYVGCAKWGRPEWVGKIYPPRTKEKDFLRYYVEIRIDGWVKRIKTWLNKGLEELYFFMHMHDEATSPELTVYLAARLNKVCGLKLVVPEFINKDYLENAFIPL